MFEVVVVLTIPSLLMALPDVQQLPDLVCLFPYFPVPPVYVKFTLQLIMGMPESSRSQEKHGSHVARFLYMHRTV